MMNTATFDTFKKDTDLQQLIASLVSLKTKTGDTQFFNQQIETIKAYMKTHNSPSENDNPLSKEPEVLPTPIPDEPLYGLLSIKPSSNSKPQLFAPPYSLQVFTDLQQARDAETGSIAQARVFFTGKEHYATLYRIKLETVDLI